MQPFSYHYPVDIRFGEGLTASLGNLLGGQYRKVLLITARGPFRENGLHGNIRTSLEAGGVTVVESPDIDSNPKISTIRQASELAREEGAEAVIALGGGSAMDAGKITAASAAMNMDPWELIWGSRPDVTVSLPLITVPTIAATGTEVNEYAVAVDDDTS